MTKKLSLSNNFSIPAIDYAGQGNAILGIRDAGKTYTAMQAGEQLLDAGIPIIVYDPVGVWKNLKIGTGKHKGYPIVTAGGSDCDIKLTVNNAVDVVRAAMKENVSMVIDLYSPELINKSTWIKVVQETIDLLMYENEKYGMRHIFIEEAAEFIPQRLQPQHSRVYASIERLARMGRNARLGYTLINQRAEEVNKSILEISALSLLHKQVGKNSLLSIQKWLELLQVQNTKEIIKSLPGLNKGQCWAIGMTEHPQLIQVLPKKTFHPDPKRSNLVAEDIKKATDVSTFVEKLNKQLVKPEAGIKENTKAKIALNNNALAEKGYQNIINELKSENKSLKNKLISLHDIIYTSKDLYSQINILFDNIIATSGNIVMNLPNENIKTKFIDSHKSTNPEKNKKPTEKLGKCAISLLTFLATYPNREFSKTQIAIATGYSSGSGGFNNALSELNIKNLICKFKDKIIVSNNPNLHDYTGDIVAKDYSIHTYIEKLGKCEAEIYRVLLDNPNNEFTKDELASKTETKYSPSSGGFNNSISRLNTLELIKRSSGLIRLNPELLEL